MVDVEKGKTYELELEIGSNGRECDVFVNGERIRNVIGANIQVHPHGPSLISLEYIAGNPNAAAVRVNFRGEAISVERRDHPDDRDRKDLFDLFSENQIDALICQDGDGVVGRLGRALKQAIAERDFASRELMRLTDRNEQLVEDLEHARRDSDSAGIVARIYREAYESVLTESRAPQEWAY